LPRDRPRLSRVADELAQLPGRRLLSAWAPAFRDREQLGRHQREVMIGLMSVRPAAEVNLCDCIEAVPGDRVHERG
jgi:hypothetical protein